MMLAVCFVKCESVVMYEREFSQTHMKMGNVYLEKKLPVFSFIAVACFARIYSVCY